MEESLLTRLETELRNVVEKCKKLAQDNHVLSEENNSLRSELNSAQEKQTMAGSRINAMLDQLKGLQEE